MSAKRLLLVDDEENVLVGMRRYFKSAGFEVDCAAEREEAEALIDHVDYEAAIVDLGLTAGHGPDGLQVIQRLRQRCPHARILVLTAFGNPETRDEALRLGADAFCQKPRPLAEIHQALVHPPASD